MGKYLYLTILSAGIAFCICLTLLLNFARAMEVHESVQGGLDAAVLAGSTQQKQVILSKDSNGEPTSWMYTIDQGPALSVAQMTWDKNVSEWSDGGLLGSTVNGPDWSFPDPNSMRGNVQLSIPFIAVPQTVTNTVAPNKESVLSQSSVNNSVFP